jgi:hypothetical protein
MQVASDAGAWIETPSRMKWPHCCRGKRRRPPEVCRPFHTDEERWGVSRAELEKRILRLHNGGMGILRIGRELGIGSGTVQGVTHMKASLKPSLYKYTCDFSLCRYGAGNFKQVGKGPLMFQRGGRGPPIAADRCPVSWMVKRTRTISASPVTKATNWPSPS